MAQDGTTYVSQNFAGLLTKKEPGQEAQGDLRATRTASRSARSPCDDGGLRFALSKNQRRGVIMAMRQTGKPWPLANIGTYEKKNNPDGKQTYGFRNLSDECAAQVPPQFGPPTYKGIVETHPYATAQADGTTYVADAAANAIFAIPRPGKVEHRRGAAADAGEDHRRGGRAPRVPGLRGREDLPGSSRCRPTSSWAPTGCST